MASLTDPTASHFRIFGELRLPPLSVFLIPFRKKHSCSRKSSLHLEAVQTFFTCSPSTMSATFPSSTHTFTALALTLWRFDLYNLSPVPGRTTRFPCLLSYNCIFRDPELPTSFTSTASTYYAKTGILKSRAHGTHCILVFRHLSSLKDIM